MSFATIDELRESLASPVKNTRSPEYIAKNMHDVPDVPSIDRAKFIISRCTGKVVLDIGASGLMHEEIVKVAKKTFGIDRPPDGMVTSATPSDDEIDAGRDVMFGLDLDDRNVQLPILPEVELVVCGEVVEHLSNPGWFLDRLRLTYARVPVIVTVPNAFSDIARRHMADGAENVNRDHAAWYSWRTLKTLVERAGYQVREFYWYNGRPGFAEGLVFVLE